MSSFLYYHTTPPKNYKCYDFSMKICVECPCGQSFDTVVLYQIPKNDSCLREVNNIFARLKPNGRLYLVDCDDVYKKFERSY